MTDNFCNDFKSYVETAINIYDIMAAACKMVFPFEPYDRLTSDNALNGIVSGYSEQYNIVSAFIDLKEKLYEWTDQQKSIDRNGFKKKLFCLVRLIDIKCVKFSKASLPNPYIQYSSLNSLFQDEIIILPRYQTSAIEILSAAISEKEKKRGREKHGFFGNNYDRTANISGYLHNFIVYDNDKSLIKPKMNILNKDGEIKNEFRQNGYKLKIGIFPLSNVNLRQIFKLNEEDIDTEGLFSLESRYPEQEYLIFERCKEALEICRDKRVDIVVFPEMLFTKKNQDAIADFIKINQEEDRRFPWFTWLGTSWEHRVNKCMVIDQYGKKVFEQKKYVPYEYKKIVPQKGKITYVENLIHDEDWTVNFLDIPGIFRIATAICRDISSGPLRDSITKLYTDMVVIPAFSNSDRMTLKHIDPIVREKMIALVCNACSSLCGESQDKFLVNEEEIEMGKEHTFCFLCMPAKCEKHNEPDYYNVRYDSACTECERRCKGYVWEISFSECITKGDLLAAKVI